jgi:hypothetical protein
MKTKMTISNATALTQAGISFLLLTVMRKPLPAGAEIVRRQQTGPLSQYTAEAVRSHRATG